MAGMYEQYAQWVKATCGCSACAIDAAGAVQHLVNRNICPSHNGQPDKSMPQAGYLGEDYPRYRVLVLGKNPAWPKDLVDDEKYYSHLQVIQDAPSLQAQTPELCKMHNSWTPLKSSELDLVHQVGLQPSEIAYSNQILCRTDHFRVDINKPNAQRGAISKISRKTIKPIYESCFRNRVCGLIEILKPKHIRAIGRLNDATRSWPHILEGLLIQSQTESIHVWHVRFPTGQGGYVNEARNDIKGLREALGIVT